MIYVWRLFLLFYISFKLKNLLIGHVNTQYEIYNVNNILQTYLSFCLLYLLHFACIAQVSIIDWIFFKVCCDKQWLHILVRYFCYKFKKTKSFSFENRLNGIRFGDTKLLSNTVKIECLIKNLGICCWFCLEICK